ncbi:MAG TPA: hypothetical protein PLU72_15895 [Candidatus Ozemobacteraceae bacterium]|nr:hypothetical protein [Candidatus Ozemobacteraceae bacterium]
MEKKLWGVLAAALIWGGAAFAVDVGSVATESRYDINDRVSNVTGIMSIPQNEIRRIPDMIDKPESQIGMWVPMIEPEPVVRGFDNRIKDNVRIFRNTGSTKDKYPYLVKEKDTGKWYAYRNVYYKWSFEDAGDDGKSGGVNGKSGGEVWSPFYKASGSERAIEYMKNIVNGSGDTTWDPKVYPNTHKKPFDSGISGDADTRGSTVLQEVGMLMTYERATVNPTVVGAAEGYYGNADISVIDPSSIPEAKLDAEPSGWETKKTVKSNPDGWKLKNLDGGNEFTAFNRVYVEDYTPPTLKGTEVRIYSGNVGGFVEKIYNKSTNKWEPCKGIMFEYEDDNPNAAASSDRLKASLNYECGNMDLYKLDNPSYNRDDPTSEPYLYFVYLPPTYRMTWNDHEQRWQRVKVSENPVRLDETVVYGPYLGPAKKAEEYYYYKNVDPNWKSRSEAEVEEYIKARYANAYATKNLAPWIRGLAYFILDERNSGLLKTKLLNGWINKAKNTKNEGLEAKVPELAMMIAEYEALGDNGKKAAADMRAFVDHLNASGMSDVNRFSYIEFKDGGRYCVGPIEFEKIGGIHSESNDGQKMTGSWFVPGPRILLPKHYANTSLEWDGGNVARMTGDQMDKDAQNFVLGADGRWKRANSAEDAGVPDELQVAGTNSNFIKKYGDTWMQKVPDLMFKVDMADCCGNTTNQVGFLKVNDSGEGALPVTEVEISDSRSGNDIKVGVPPSDELASDREIAIQDSGSKVQVPGGEFSDNDMATKKWMVVDKSGNPVDDPLNAQMKLDDKVIFEDTRLNLTAQAYDNIDRAYPGRGIAYQRIQIRELDKNGNPTDKFEPLEDASGNKSDKIERIVPRERFVRNDKTEPVLKFYHIFRNPGQYRVEYLAEDFEANKQNLSFNVTVKDMSFQDRTIRDESQRTNTQGQ